MGDGAVGGRAAPINRVVAPQAREPGGCGLLGGGAHRPVENGRQGDSAVGGRPHVDGRVQARECGGDQGAKTGIVRVVGDLQPPGDLGRQPVVPGELPADVAGRSDGVSSNIRAMLSPR
jgi:hypothetical protein